VANPVPQLSQAAVTREQELLWHSLAKEQAVSLGFFPLATHGGKIPMKRSVQVTARSAGRHATTSGTVRFELALK